MDHERRSSDPEEPIIVGEENFSVPLVAEGDIKVEEDDDVVYIDTETTMKYITGKETTVYMII